MGKGKITKMNISTKIVNQILLICLVTLLTSCYNNVIYFDMDKQLVRTCNSRSIRDLYIDTSDDKSLYNFIKIEGKEGTNSFSLTNLDKNYNLEVMGVKVPLERFVLKPNVTYTITNHTYGDTDESDIKIKTDEQGKVIEASRKSCNN
jgi:hypothetical protein